MREPCRYLKFSQVANLVNAVAFAHCTGHRLTVSITLIWAHVPGFQESRLSNMTTTFLDRLGRWLRRHGNVELRAVWTRERGREKGHHFNIMANIPVRLVKELSAYLIKSFGIRQGGLNMTYGDYGMKILNMQMGKLRYICKSMDHYAFVYRGYETCNVADMLGLRHAGTDGAIMVKRAGTTQNISRKARREADWQDKSFIEDIADLLTPESRRKTIAA